MKKMAMDPQINGWWRTKIISKNPKGLPLLQLPTWCFLLHQGSQPAPSTAGIQPLRSDWGIDWGIWPPNIRSLAAKCGNWLNQCYEATLVFHTKPKDLPSQRTPCFIGRRNTSLLALCLALCASPRDLPRLLRFRTCMDGWIDRSIIIW